MTDKQQLIFDLASGGFAFLLLHYWDRWFNRRREKATHNKSANRNDARRA